MVTSLAENFPVQAEVHVVNEHRVAPRRRLLKAGKITFGGGAAFDCTVRNLSETGAALEVGSPVGIPERFTLVIEANRLHVPCRVVWRKEKRIGVHFET
jgi:PilZ domain-containing protein